MKFYLNNQEVKVNTNASFTKIVGSKDIGSCELELTTNKEKIAPMTPFKVVSGDDTWNFVVSQDNVEQCTKKEPILYKHTLSFVENIHELSTHILRNSQFRQPIGRNQNLVHGIPIAMKVLYKTDNTIVFDKNAYFPLTISHTEEGNKSELMRLGSRNTPYFAYIEVETRMQCFKYRLIEGASSIVYNIPKSLKKNSFETITFRICDENSDEYLEFTLDSNANNKVYLTFLQMAWLKNKTFYLSVVSATFSQPDDLEYLDEYNNPIKSDTIYSRNVLGHIKLNFVCNQYTWTLYDILETIEKQVRKDFNGSSHDPLYVMPDKESEKGEILSSTIAPDLDFTGLDLFSAVAKIMQYIDAYPTIDENGVLGFDYINDQSKTPSIIAIADKTSSLNEQYYTNKLVVPYQNAKQSNSVFFPSNKTFSRMNANGYGVPNKTSYEFKVDKPIDYIDKLLVYTDSFVNVRAYYPYDEAEIPHQFNDIEFRGVRWFEGTLDIALAVIEESEYSTLKYENAEDSFPNQLNTLTYTQHGNSIRFGAIADTDGNMTIENVYKYALYWSAAKFFGFKFYNDIEPDTEDRVSGLTDLTETGFNTKKIQDLHLQLEYHAVFDGQTSIESTIEKHNGETFVSQTDSSPELNRMGRNMQGLIARLGNETKNISLSLDSYDNRLKIGSLWVDDDNNKYIANKIKTTFSTREDKVITEVEFTKNFNSLSSFTSLDQEKRMYEIDTRITTKGYENITEYIYFSTTNIDSINEQIALSEIAIETICNVEKTLHSSGDIAYIKSYENEEDISSVDYNEINETTSIDCVAIPLHTYGLGNMLCFEMGYQNSINAGDRLVGDDTYFNKTCLYTSKNGYSDKFDIVVKHIYSEIVLNENYPLMSSGSLIGSETLRIENMFYYKRPNEIFHLNYELAFMPYMNEEIYFGKEFINNNGVIPTSSLTSREIYVYVSYEDKEKYSILDDKALGTNIGKATMIYNEDEYSINAQVSVGSLNKVKIKSWCLADERKNIIIAVNEDRVLTTDANNVFSLFYATRKTRI